MNTKPKVAVIMSVYRSDNLIYLKEAINSILAQTYDNIDLYLYRDGCISRDIDEYLCEISSKEQNVRLFLADENHGLAYALNYLLDRALEDGEIEFIARMDSDDVSRSERISKQVQYLQNNRAVDVCGTSCHEFGASFALDEKHLPRFPEELLNYSITHCPFIHPSVMFRIKVFRSGIRYPTDTSLTEDMALWFLLLKNDYRFANINEILLDYRLSENTLERRRGLSKATSEFAIRFTNMITLKKVTVRNVILIFARLLFHILPAALVKVAYRVMR